MWRALRPLTQTEKNSVQSNVEKTYRRFLQVVSSARSKPPEEIHKVAQGRVWSGVHAKKNGLVDELGSLDMAIKKAAEFAGIKDYEVTLQGRPNPWRHFINSTSSQIQSKIFEQLGWSSKDISTVKTLKKISQRTGVLTISPWNFF